jgi:hypothetical protein
LAFHPASFVAQKAALHTPKSATKFDEYGQISADDHSARLDNFAIQLEKQPTSTACVVVFGPYGEGFSPSQANLDRIRDYLVNSRGIEDSRIKTLYGGRNTDLAQPKIELWLVPRGAALPKPKKNETDIETFKGKFSDEVAWDDVTIPGVDECGCGPPIMPVTEASFADVLNHQKTAAAYLVAYNGKDAAPGAWRRVAQAEVEALKSYTVDENRVKIIFGGIAKETRLQLWVLPADAPPPVKDAGPEKAPAKAIEVGTFSDYELGEPKNEQAALSRLVEMLKQFPELRLCLIVTIGTWTDEVEIEGAQALPEPTPAHDAEPADPDPSLEISPADIPVLVEKWKTELAKTHKIIEGRVVILFTTSSDFTNQQLSAWVVPPNQPLPDPNAKDEERPDDDPPNQTGKPTEAIKPSRTR